MIVELFPGSLATYCPSRKQELQMLKTHKSKNQVLQPDEYQILCYFLVFQKLMKNHCTNNQCFETGPVIGVVRVLVQDLMV